MVAFADGDPVYADVFERLDLHDDEERCGLPDTELFEPLPGRYLVGYGEPPGDDHLALLGSLARVRWVFAQLRLIEVETQQAEAVSALPGVAGVVPAWKSLGSTRRVVVGLNAMCIFAARQASDDEAAYRHPPGLGYPVLTGRDGRVELDLDRELELSTPPALIPVINMSLRTTSVGFPTAAGDIANLATLGASSDVLVVVAAGNCGDTAPRPCRHGRGRSGCSAWERPTMLTGRGSLPTRAGGCRAPTWSRSAGPS
jgi:hypothetical protein